MLMLYPLIVIALLCWWLRLERRAQAAWREHPDRPWNVQARLAREAHAWHLATYRPKAR